MKKLMIILLITASQSAHSAQSVLEKVRNTISILPNVSKGHYQIGGDFSVGSANDSGQTTQSFFTLSPKLEYFFDDNASFGGFVSYSNYSGSNGYTTTSLGPSGTYYFQVANQNAFYIAQSVAMTKYDGDSKNYLSGRSSIGIRYFLAAEVAFGTELFVSYRIGNDNKYSIFGVAGNFNIFH